ncbi:hypothetical protein XA68_13071 [Ophiocordyceps unilateralis]|uniref:Zn(2)-C6 fungal-type domain-containing protein n=1 Tax=Ophiocordyceps unilateralis TaxID=268505 RepID=A0A2A9PDJ6_OPHUN|nr:hypothetical protein XA68_13071 [Ophiocordyceps unilateralis]
MPAVKHPCLQCKEKHVKCDEERPKCRRCELRHLPCSRPVRKTVFKHDSVASFSKDQKWVNSQAKHFRFHPRGAATARDPPPVETIIAPLDLSRIPRRDPLGLPRCLSPHSLRNGRPDHCESTRESNPFPPPAIPSIAYITSPPGPYERSNTESSSTASPLPYPPHESPALPSLSLIVAQPGCDDGSSRFPLLDVQEACLLRYFIDEMSHWFDLCDQHRHFQLVVPVRAAKHPHLLHAIFAVAARHLSRLPQYKTSQGILYHGQLLPNLNEHAAVEYMLKCIPALRQFHDMHDEDYRDSIITTAVILRQLEEIDQEDDSGIERKQVNFLAIIDAVLRSLPSFDVFGQRSLMQAAYWMALRQEIFNSFTRHEAPQLMLPLEFWHSASKANKVVMHLVQTAKWHWGDGSEVEWQRLSKQQELIEQNVLVAFRPTYQRTADKTKGEIFPTIWYASNIDVTSIQLSLIAKAVLVAENPYLKSPTASRANWRHVENEVRVLLLDLCAIALCHPASPPSLVHSALGIGMYGDFFTDPYERQAIRTVVERYRDAHAWPVQRLLEKFR